MGVLALACAALLGCGSSSTVTDAASAPDGGTDAPVSVDAPSVMPDAPSCDLSPVPAPLPMLAGSFLVEGPGVMPPTPSGSEDPVGVWLFDRVTLYVSAGAGEMFDATMSTANGTSWLSFDGTEVRLDMSFVLTLADTIGGDITRSTRTRIRGTYEIVGSDVVFTPSCVEAMTSGGAPPSFDFAAEGDRGTLVIQTMGMLGTTTLVLEGSRAP